MIYDPGTGIGLRSSQELAKIVLVIVNLCKAFNLTASVNKTKTMRMLALGGTQRKFEVRTTGQQHAETNEFVYL